MGQYLNPGNAGFSSAVHSQIYVDKTGLLEYLNMVFDTEQRYVCVSRPRRFGKSIAARMVAAYYGKECNSEELFSVYKIAEKVDAEKYGEYKKHLNKYNVIHLDITDMWVTRPKEQDFVQYVQTSVIDELRVVYSECVEDEAFSLPQVLSRIEEKTGERFIVIIDEWDHLFRENKNDTKMQSDYMDLLRGLFKGERAQRFIHLAYITGILPIKRYSNESALNNFDEFTMLHPEPLTEFVGFTEDEVKNLCKKYTMDFSEMQKWYDGYVLEKGKHIYNPKSLTDAIRRRRIANYWTNTAAYESLADYISMDFDGLKTAMIQLLAGEPYCINIRRFENDMTSFKSRDDVLTLLVHLGYLSYNFETKEVRIPNAEVRTVFEDALTNTNWEPVINTLEKSQKLLRDTWNLDADAVAAGIEDAHMEFASILKYNDENSLRCVLRLGYYNAVNEYMVMDELPTGKGYTDVVFLPRPGSDKPALVIELKYDKSAEGAIAQIKKKQYVKKLDAYKGNILLVGINYNKDSDDKKHTCIIEWVQK